MKYRTIVADPPWTYGRFNGFSSGQSTTSAAALRGEGQLSGDTKPLPYPSMTLDEIRALPVGDLADEQSHLYLWTTQRYLFDAPSILEAWGFRKSCVLTWAKPEFGGALGWAFVPTTEFVVFGQRGGLEPLTRWRSTFFAAPRQYRAGGGGPVHSAKPEVLMDIAEQVSPGPRLEMFARRQRLGWDTWGDESLCHVDLGGVA